MRIWEAMTTKSANKTICQAEKVDRNEVHEAVEWPVAGRAKVTRHAPPSPSRMEPISNRLSCPRAVFFWPSANRLQIKSASWRAMHR